MYRKSLGIALMLVTCAFLVAQDTKPTKKGTDMTREATGTFEVKLTPQPLEHGEGDTTVGTMVIDKTLSGDLEGTSWGLMVSAVTQVKGSAGYVAMERITGKLHGREGSFVLQHSATMSGGGQSQDITVVPDSATGALKGLSGTFLIHIDKGAHAYTFTYSLPEGD